MEIILESAQFHGWPLTPVDSATCICFKSEFPVVLNHEVAGTV